MDGKLCKPEVAPFILAAKVEPPPPEPTRFENLDELFAQRTLDKPTSAVDIFIHLLKAALGTGILAMPKAFECAGLLMGIILTTIVSIICTHCAYIVVVCAHEIYKRTGRHTMSYAEVTVESFKEGPQCLKKFGPFFKFFIPAGLFTTYFLVCSVYCVLIAYNVLDVLNHFGIEISSNKITSVRILMACFIIPFLFIVWVPNLHYLAPVSLLANVFMGIGLGITFYFLLVGGNALDDPEFRYFREPSLWGLFLSLTIFALQVVGVMLPLENSMKQPRKMIGCFGVLNLGLTCVTIIYITLGILGYIRFGPKVKGSITLNLGETIPAQVVKIFISIAVYCTFGLQFYICRDISNRYIMEKFNKRPILADYIARSILAVIAILLGILVPSIAPIMGLVGAFCFSIIGLIIPVILDVVTFWNVPNGLGFLKWVLIKDVFIGIFGIIAVVFGTLNAVEGIIEAYT